MDTITKPTLILDEAQCKANIKKMSDKAKRLNLTFRPHFKTHISSTIGEWLRDEGVNKITVSSVSMAQQFARYGWKDITIAFPFNILEDIAINRLPENIRLNLVVESPHVIAELRKRITRDVGIYIKIDTGNHRAGISADDYKTINAILDGIDMGNQLHFVGFMVHSGQTYHVQGKQAVEKIHRDTVDQLRKLKQQYIKTRRHLILSVGDTPSCSLSDYFEDIDEIRPGNFVFYDMMQHQIGSCDVEEIAVALACPVVAKHPDRNEIVLYGGAIHFSKDSVKNTSGETMYGQLAAFNDKGWHAHNELNYLKTVSQEHGILKVTNQVFQEIEVGDVVAVLPVHSCLTANLMRKYQTLNGKEIKAINLY
ncbi:MAG: alanine racemase [Bacteroidales bacterium]|nr:alanine racemase [Bacteroidales bacterium]